MLFGSLDLFPVAQHRSRRTLHRGIDIGPVSRRARSLFAKDVGMPAHQLAIQMVQHLGNGEMALVGRHLRIKQHLQQQIAQFLGQVRKVAPLNGVEDLVGLFQRVFADGIEGLFAVPGAAVGRAQPRHDGHRLLKQAPPPAPDRLRVCGAEACAVELSGGRSMHLQSTLPVRPA